MTRNKFGSFGGWFVCVYVFRLEKRYSVGKFILSSKFQEFRKDSNCKNRDDKKYKASGKRYNP